MTRDILGEYGPGSDQPQASTASCGGVLPGETKDVMNYQAPQGPKGIMAGNTVGLHGRNSGNTNRPTSTSAGGSPGIGGTNHGCCGSQGKY
jgi:hypothetical protein